ncbi:MAG: DUF938 domain-containing protein [Parerythrobacter sp.]
MKRYAPATQRNSGPIADILATELAHDASVLEIASGTGEHAVFMAARFPHMTWQPSDPDAEAVHSIAAWREEAASEAILQPIRLDARIAPWPVGTFDAIFCANMIHIAPWDATVGLFESARTHLEPDGALLLYGPFMEADTTTAASNIAFDASLRERDAEWGIRELAACNDLARTNGLQLTARHTLPANNLIVVYRQAQAGQVA